MATSGQDLPEQERELMLLAFGQPTDALRRQCEARFERAAGAAAGRRDRHSPRTPVGRVRLAGNQPAGLQAPDELGDVAGLSEHLSDGASVVVTSSTSTYEGAAMTSVYAATKGALVAMARAWATELAGRGIRVNVLVPGAISTSFRDFMSEDVREDFETGVVGRVPLGRIGTADEAAAVALFLLSDESRYVTASQYAVDGGLTMR